MIRSCNLNADRLSSGDFGDKNPATYCCDHCTPAVPWQSQVLLFCYLLHSISVLLLLDNVEPDALLAGAGASLRWASGRCSSSGGEIADPNWKFARHWPEGAQESISSIRVHAACPPEGRQQPAWPRKQESSC